MEQKEAFEEAINAHATMGKAVMQATTSQCGELQNEIVELRSMTKKELSSLQGVLEVSSTHKFRDLIVFPNQRLCSPLHSYRHR